MSKRKWVTGLMKPRAMGIRSMRVQVLPLELGTRMGVGMVKAGRGDNSRHVLPWGGPSIHVSGQENKGPQEHRWV